MAIDYVDMKDRLVEALAASVATSMPTAVILRWPQITNNTPFVQYRFTDDTDVQSYSTQTDEFEQTVEIRVIGGFTDQQDLSEAENRLLRAFGEIRSYWRDRTNRQLITSTYNTKPAYVHAKGGYIVNNTGFTSFLHFGEEDRRGYGFKFDLRFYLIDY